MKRIPRKRLEKAFYLRWGGLGASLIGALLVAAPLLMADKKSEQNASSSSEASGSEETSHEETETKYTCPMHPDVRQPEPGQCPICGMDLVAAESQSSPSTEGSSGNGMSSEMEHSHEGHQEPNTSEEKTSSSEATEYTCPMHPDVRQPEPGRCPICGMELVPAKAEETGSDGEALFISEADRRLAGIKTAKAELRDVERTIETVGMVEYDESQVATIAAYVPGRVERLFADYTGVRVGEGDHLVQLYSPSLYAAQEEFVQAAQASGSALQKSLFTGARQKLRELGMSQSQIESLERSRSPKSRLTVNAPIGGTVIEKFVNKGEYVKEGQSLYKVADLSTVWLMLELYPEEAELVRYGTDVTGTVQSQPGKTFDGKVAFIDPTVDRRTRTVNVRVEIDNPDGSLRPGDYAEARITVPIEPRQTAYDPEYAGKFVCPMHPHVVEAKSGNCPICGMNLVPSEELGFSPEPVERQKPLVVPRGALLSMGKQSVVFVADGDGRFTLRRVTVGSLTESEAVISQGLEEGEEVASHGTFLIDSQMQLTGKTSLIDVTAKGGKEESP